MLDEILQIDYSLFHLLNGEWHHPWIDAIMPWWRDKKTWVPLYVLVEAFCFYR